MNIADMTTLKTSKKQKWCEIKLTEDAANNSKKRYSALTGTALVFLRYEKDPYAGKTDS